MSAWTRTVAARRVIALAWLVQLAAAWLAGSALASVTGASVHPYAQLDDDRLLFDLGELFMDHAAVPTLLAFVLLASAVVGGLAWALAFPAIAISLHTPTPLAELARECVRRAPAMLVLAVYAAVARAVLVGPLLALAIATELGTWSVAPLLVMSGIATIFADRARVDAILHGQRAYSPRAFARSCRRTLRAPATLAAGLGLCALGWGLHGATLALGGGIVLGAGTVWAMRALSAVSTFVAWWRVATIVQLASAVPGGEPAVAHDAARA